jgi:hypothetical protein
MDKETAIQNIKKRCEEKNYTFLGVENDSNEINISKTRFFFKCNKDNHQWYAIYNNFIRHNTGCPKCGGKLQLTNDIATQRILSRCEEKNYAFLGFAKNVYINSHSLLKLKCNIDEYQWQVTYASFIIHQTGCPKCGKTLKFSEKEVLEKIKEKCKEKNYEFIEWIGGEYKNTEDSKMILRCLNDNYCWETSYHSFIRRQTGCPKCAKRPLITTNIASQIINQICVDKNFTFIGFKNGVYNNINTRLIMQCNKCNREWEVSYTKLIHKGTGCPYCIESAGENKIFKFLKDKNVKFYRQHRFDNCRNKRKLPFDFYLPDYNICIEYDGEQHFVAKENWNTPEELAYIQKNDKIKSNYCKKYKIKLLRISYKDGILSKLENNISY